MLPINTEAQPSWRVRLSIECEDWQENLHFGLHPNALEYFDTNLDTILPPPGFGPYAYFYIDTFPNYLLTDMRDTDDTVTWHLQTVNCPGKPLRLKWDIEDYRQKVEGNADLEIDGYTDMTTVDSLWLVGDIVLKIRFSKHPSDIFQCESGHVSSKKPVLAFPNPFNDCVSIVVNIKKSCCVDVSIYDIMGRLVANVYNGFLTTNSRVIKWSGRGQYGDELSTGIYFCRTRWGNQEYYLKIQFIR